MHPTDENRSPPTRHPAPLEARAGLIEVAAGGARIVRIGVSILLTRRLRP